MATKFKYNVWVADFETSTEEWALRKGFTEVWAYALTNAQINSRNQLDLSDTAIVYTNYGKPGNPFDLFLTDLLNHCHDGDKVYFHNLKFDGKFLISGLLERGFKDVTNEFNTQQERKQLFDESFSVLVAGNAWYSIEVEFGGKRIEFRDSLKRIPMGVRRMAKEYKLPILKGDIDYNRNPDLPMTVEELKYIRHDVLIVAEVTRQQYQEGFTQLTTAGYAFAEYRKWLKSRGMDFNELFPILDSETQSFVRKAYEGGEVYCNPRFKGKVTGDPRSTQTIGYTWDINSMYPAKMSAATMPYGQAMSTTAKMLNFKTVGEWQNWRGRHYRYFIEIKRCLATIRPGRIPSVGVVAGFGVRDYPERIDLIDCTMADIRFEQVILDYDIQYMELGKVVYFNARMDLFFDYIQEIVAEKNRAAVEGNIMRKAMAKVKMNSLYGKFGQKSTTTSAFFTWDETVGLCSNSYISEAGCKYIPVAAIITAEARRLLISQANKFGSSAVAYMDTDSIHVIDKYHNVKPWRRRPLPGKGEKDIKNAQMEEVLTQEQLVELVGEFENGRPNEVWCDEFDLGAFKIEGKFACAKWLRAKTYFEATFAEPGEVAKHFQSIKDEEWDGEYYAIPERGENPSYHLIGCIKGAGIPEEAKMEITVENFNIGLVLPGKLQPKAYKGGVVLHETTYEIKPQWTEALMKGDAE